MGLGIVLAFWAVVGVALFAAAAALSFAVRRLWRIEHGRLSWLLKAAPWFAGAAPVVLFAVLLVASNVMPPQFVFKRVFGTSLGATVHDLRRASSGATDAEMVFMSFRAPPTTVAALSKGFHKPAGPADDYLPLPGDTASPDWWTPKQCASRRVMVAENLRDWDDIVLAHCPADGRVYVQARWVE